MGITTSVNLVSPPSLPPVSFAVPTPRAWFAAFARSSILAVLEDAVQHGHLVIMDRDCTYTFGPRPPPPSPGSSGAGAPGQSSSRRPNAVTMRVANDAFWTRVLLSGDLGFSEAYMIGDVHVDNLKGVMDLWLDNQAGLAALSSALAKLGAALSGLSNAFAGQTRARARLNAIASYDQSNALFQAFLSREMMYSCALWGAPEGGPRGDVDPARAPRPDELEAAQLRKLHHVLRRARVRPGGRVLEFGSGWGGLAIEAAQTFGCEVDTLTLSVQQKALAEARVRAAGLEGRVRVHLMDYRELPPEWEKAFDAFVSVEMIEHVGPKHYNTYFRLVDWALKPDRAAAVVTSSTFPEARFSAYQAEDFMRRYMWPNSSLPSATALVGAAHAAAQGRFTLEGVENHAAHYPRTLREWARRLDAHLTQELLVPDFPALRARAEFDAFRRKWQYLFAYAGAGFAKGYISCHMLTFIRQNDAPAVECD